MTTAELTATATARPVHWGRALIGAAVTGALFDPMTRLLEPVFTDGLGEQCDGGLDGLGCVFALRLLFFVVTSLLGGVVGSVVLTALRVRHGWMVGLLGIPSVFGGWPLLRTSWDSVWHFPALIGLHLAAYAVMLLMVTATPGPIAVRVALPVLVALAGYLATGWFGSFVDHRTFVAAQQQEQAALSFPVLVARDLPEGYELYDVMLPITYEGAPEEVEQTYLFGHNDPMDPRPFTIRQWSTTPRLVDGRAAPNLAPFAPPTDCGPDRLPSDGGSGVPYRETPCEQVGALSDGTPVWRATAPWTSDVVLVAETRGTHVVLSPGYGDGTLTVDDALKALDSLTPRTSSDGY